MVLPSFYWCVRWSNQHRWRTRSNPGIRLLQPRRWWLRLQGRMPLCRSTIILGRGTKLVRSVVGRFGRMFGQTGLKLFTALDEVVKKSIQRIPKLCKTTGLLSSMPTLANHFSDQVKWCGFSRGVIKSASEDMAVRNSPSIFAPCANVGGKNWRSSSVRRGEYSAFFCSSFMTASKTQAN